MLQVVWLVDQVVLHKLEPALIEFWMVATQIKVVVFDIVRHPDHIVIEIGEHVVSHVDEAYNTEHNIVITIVAIRHKVPARVVIHKVVVL